MPDMANLILRYLRTVIWGGCGSFAIYSLVIFENFLLWHTDLSAPQLAALASTRILEFLSIYVAARSADRILALIQEDFPRKAKQPHPAEPLPART